MNKEEIQKVYKYFELLNQFEKLEKEIKDIITKNSDIDMDYGCSFVEIVEREKHYDEKREEYYLCDEHHLAYQQNNYFLWQIIPYEDSCYGNIFYPLEDNKYIRIEYSY